MRYILAALLLISTFSYGQIDLPELSPEAMIVEKVGYTTITMRYGRPAARERKIMGELVPYGKLWRTGAGRCTVISFDQPVIIGGKNISAGAYALLTIPGKQEWTVLLNTDTAKVYGEPYEYDPKNEVLAFCVASEKINTFHQSMTISFDIARYDATLRLSWEETTISFPIRTHSFERALAEIKKAVGQHPKDQETLTNAAWFYYMNNLDPQQILAWIDTALAQGDERWAHQLRFDVLERMQNYDGAKESALRAIRFLETTKPISWEEGVQGYKERMAKWAKK